MRNYSPMGLSLPLCVSIQASNEAETRTKKFDDLYEDLEDFYNIVEDLDQWMDTAVEKGHGIKVSQQDLEVQYGMLKVNTYFFLMTCKSMTFFPTEFKCNLFFWLIFFKNRLKLFAKNNYFVLLILWIVEILVDKH